MAVLLVKVDLRLISRILTYTFTSLGSEDSNIKLGSIKFTISPWSGIANNCSTKRLYVNYTYMFVKK